MALAFLRNARNFSVSGACLLRGIHPVSLPENVMTIAKQTRLLPKTPIIFSKSISLSARRFSAQSSYIGLWKAERIVSIAIAVVIPAAFIMPSQILDAVMAVSVVMHQHWGLEAITKDYIRPDVVGKFASKLAHITVILASIATLGGLFYFIHNDIGIANSIKKLWAIKAQA